MSHWVNKSVSQWVIELISQWVSQLVSQCVRGRITKISKISLHNIVLINFHHYCWPRTGIVIIRASSQSARPALTSETSVTLQKKLPWNTQCTFMGHESISLYTRPLHDPHMMLPFPHVTDCSTVSHCHMSSGPAAHFPCLVIMMNNWQKFNFQLTMNKQNFIYHRVFHCFPLGNILMNELIN